MSVSGLTLTGVLRHGNIRPSVAINQRVASSARRGLINFALLEDRRLFAKKGSPPRNVWERIARGASLTGSKATKNEVWRQRVMARTSNDTGMNAQDLTLRNVTRARF